MEIDEVAKMIKVKDPAVVLKYDELDERIDWANTCSPSWRARSSASCRLAYAMTRIPVEWEGHIQNRPNERMKYECNLREFGQR